MPALPNQTSGCLRLWRGHARPDVPELHRPAGARGFESLLADCSALLLGRIPMRDFPAIPYHLALLLGTVFGAAAALSVTSWCTAGGWAHIAPEPVWNATKLALISNR